MPGHILLATIKLENSNGKTLYTDLAVFQSIEDRDGMLQSGMEEGANDTMDRLEELINRR